MSGPGRTDGDAARPAPPGPEPVGRETPPLLEVRGLRVTFPGVDGSPEARAVDGVSFELAGGEALGIVGESGSGKSLTALSILRLVDEPPARTDPDSSVRYRGEELVGAEPARLRRIRGGEVGFIFQEPMTSLNPVHRVGAQVAEAVRAHARFSRAAALARARELLARVELPDPDRALRAYPHELSGGMRQRAMIAIAIASDPAILIADEPTTALDVTVQAQILELLDSLRRERGMALLFISHDLAVISRVADRVAVMYGGEIVETGPAADVFGRPRHPYTEGLLHAVPSLETPTAELAMIPGTVPAPSAWPPGCRFHPRCPYAWDRCAREVPPEGDVRCWLERFPERRAGGYAPAGR